MCASMRYDVLWYFATFFIVVVFVAFGFLWCYGFVITHAFAQVMSQICQHYLFCVRVFTYILFTLFISRFSMSSIFR